MPLRRSISTLRGEDDNPEVKLVGPSTSVYEVHTHTSGIRYVVKMAPRKYTSAVRTTAVRTYNMYDALRGDYGNPEVKFGGPCIPGTFI